MSSLAQYNIQLGNYTINLVVVAIIILAVIGILIAVYKSNPFNDGLPCVVVMVDLSNRKKVIYRDCIEEWINGLDNPTDDIINYYNDSVSDWEYACKRKLYKYFLFKKHRQSQYESVCEIVDSDNYEVFKFVFYRLQTRYKQVNYVKSPYKVKNIENIEWYTLNQVLGIDSKLRKIGYETTLNKYNAKDQRKLVTPEVRKRIMKRDNYTCQKCGKYMPDEVGLHVDHIIPVSKGGKTVDSNLQVLCSKCNGSKGNKI